MNTIPQPLLLRILRARIGGTHAAPRRICATRDLIYCNILLAFAAFTVWTLIIAQALRG
jgi:hypothetical protein